MLGGDFNAANIDWDTGIVPDSTDNRLMKEKLLTVLAEAGRVNPDAKRSN